MLLFMLWGVSSPVSLAHADDAISLSKGQTIYVPCYSHIYAGNQRVAGIIDRDSQPQKC